MEAFAKVQHELATLDAGRLHCRDDRHLLALLLRRLALRGQVGHHPRTKARKRFGYVCVVLGLGLAVMAYGAWAFLEIQLLASKPPAFS